MRGLHIFVAFIMASILMSGAYCGVWKYTMSYSLENLPAILNNTMPGQVKYTNTETNYHPFKPKVTLKDTSIVVSDPKTGGTAVLNLGDVVLNITPFGSKDIVIQVPKKITMVTTYQGRSNDYRISLIEPTLELKGKDKNFEAILSVSGMVVKGRTKGYFSNLIKMGYSYISKNEQSDEFGLMMTNLDLTSIPLFKKAPVFKSLSLIWHPKLENTFPLGYALAGAGSKDKVIFDTMLMDVFKIYAGNSKVLLTDARLAYNGIWYAFNGDVALNENLVLKGQGALSSNKFGDMLGNIENVMDGFPIALSRMMERIGGKENKTQSISVGVYKDVLTINGAPVGIMPTVPELIHLHGRGQR